MLSKAIDEALRSAPPTAVGPAMGDVADVQIESKKPSRRSLPIFKKTNRKKKLTEVRKRGSR